MKTGQTPPWHRFTLTEGLEPAQVERLQPLTKSVEWPAGTQIYQEGDADSPLYLVEEGRVAIELTVPGRGPVKMLTVGPGDLFGWSSLFYDRPKSAAARAVVPTRAWALDSGGLRALCNADPALGYVLTRRLLHAVSERLKTSRLQLIDVFKS